MAQIFPGVLSTLLDCISAPIRSQVQILEESGDRPRVGMREAVATLERLGSRLLTGSNRVIPTAVWKPIGLSHSLLPGRFPHINKQVGVFQQHC